MFALRFFALWLASRRARTHGFIANITKWPCVGRLRMPGFSRDTEWCVPHSCTGSAVPGFRRSSNQAALSRKLFIRVRECFLRLNVKSEFGGSPRTEHPKNPANSINLNMATTQQARFFAPLYPTLRLQMTLPRSGRKSAPFPFDNRSLHYFYMARNGIYA